MKCETCEVDHNGDYGSGRFCSSKCARGFSTLHNRDQINQKRSATNKERGVTFTRRGPSQLNRPEVRAKANATRSKRAKDRVFSLAFEDLNHKGQRKIRILFEQDGKCEMCGMESYWNGKPLNFHLDHCNGDNTDNSRCNLRMVCPNCHSQTETYCGRNKRLKRLSNLD